MSEEVKETVAAVDEPTIAGSSKDAVDETQEQPSPTDETAESSDTGESKDVSPESDEAVEKEEPGVPESYDLDIPESMQVTDEAKASLDEKFREAGLTQEQAKTVFSMYTDTVEDMNRTLTKQSAAWLDESKKDPDIGGSNFKSTTANVRRVTTRFGDEAFEAIMDETGLGNHPALLRFLNKVGASLAEDRSGSGSATSRPANRSLHEALYSKVDVDPASKEGTN